MSILKSSVELLLYPFERILPRTWSDYSLLNRLHIRLGSNIQWATLLRDWDLLFNHSGHVVFIHFIALIKIPEWSHPMAKGDGGEEGGSSAVGVPSGLGTLVITSLKIQHVFDVTPRSHPPR